MRKLNAVNSPSSWQVSYHPSLGPPLLWSSPQSTNHRQDLQWANFLSPSGGHVRPLSSTETNLNPGSCRFPPALELSKFFPVYLCLSVSLAVPPFPPALVMKSPEGARQVRGSLRWKLSCRPSGFCGFRPGKPKTYSVGEIYLQSQVLIVRTILR